MKWMRMTAFVCGLIVLMCSTSAMAVLPTPTLSISKTSAYVDENFTLSWTSSSGATRYLVQYSNYSDFGTSNGFFWTSTAITLSYPTTGTVYFRIIADDEFTGESSDFSNVESIVIMAGSPPDPANDLQISSKSCDTAYEGQEFCCSVTLKNYGSNCYAIDEVDVERESGPSLSFSNNVYINDYTLCDGESMSMDGFCATPSTSGTSVMNLDVSVSSSWYNNIDTFSIPVNCVSQCSSGQTGCNGTSQRWSCGEAGDGDSCYEKLYTNCSSGYYCSSGTCVAYPPPSAPALQTSDSNPTSDSTYTLSWTSTGVGYEIEEATNSSFTGASGFSTVGTSNSYSHSVTSNTTYYYRVRALDSYGQYSPWSSTVSVIIAPSCTSNCTSGDIGCSNTTDRYECQEVQLGCWQKVDVETCSLGCSAGVCNTCLDECGSGEIGCNGTGQSYTCGEAGDGDICLDKIYTNCSSGYECSAGSCQLVNNPPVITDHYLDSATNIFYSRVEDTDDDPISWFTILLLEYPGWAYYDQFYLSKYSGTSSINGLWYSVDLHSLPENTYGYSLQVYDGKESTSIPGVGQQFPTFDIVDPLTALIIPSKDVLVVGEEFDITIISNKDVGFEIGMGDGYGYSYYPIPVFPITYSYDRPGIYNISLTAYYGADQVTVETYVLVVDNWLDYYQSEVYTTSAREAKVNSYNTSIIQQLNSRLEGGQ